MTCPPGVSLLLRFHGRRLPCVSPCDVQEVRLSRSSLSSANPI